MQLFGHFLGDDQRDETRVEGFICNVQCRFSMHSKDVQIFRRDITLIVGSDSVNIMV